MRKTSREQIVASAADLFREKGYKATTLADIAERVGILKGSLYHHISSKEELLLEIVQEPVTSMVTELEEIASRPVPPRQRLLDAAMMHLRHLRDDYPYIFVYLQERIGQGAEESDVVLDLSRRYQVLLEQIIDDGVAAGEFRSDMSPRLMTFFALGAWNWLHKWYTPDGEWNIEEVSKAFSLLLLEGVSATPEAT